MIRRRALVGLPAIVWGLRSGDGFSQSRDGLRRIGVLMPNSADDPSIRLRANALVEGLATRFGTRVGTFGSIVSPRAPLATPGLFYKSAMAA